MAADGGEEGDGLVMLCEENESDWRKGKWSTNEYNFKQRLLTSLKLVVIQNYGGRNLEIGGIRIYC